MISLKKPCNGDALTGIGEPRYHCYYKQILTSIDYMGSLAKTLGEYTSKAESKN